MLNCLTRNEIQEVLKVLKWIQDVLKHSITVKADKAVCRSMIPKRYLAKQIGFFANYRAQIVTHFHWNPSFLLLLSVNASVTTSPTALEA